jgi:hypothetical protein
MLHEMKLKVFHWNNMEDMNIHLPSFADIHSEAGLHAFCLCGP